MKKLLLVPVLLGALSGAALAQPNITLYGRLDSGIGVADSDAPGSDDTVLV